MEEKKKENKRLLIASAVMFFISLLLQVMARNVPGFGEWYSRSIYPLIVGILGGVTGLFPFALLEVLSIFCFLFFLIYAIRSIRNLKKILISSIFTLTLLFFLFTINCGINYYRRPFSTYSGLAIKESSIEDLISLCENLTETLNHMSESGTGKLELKGMGAESVAAMRQLGQVYPELNGFYPQPKPLLWSYVFSIQQLCGQYSPFTAEAIYNRSMPDYNIPHTLCHELSHLRGFMREDEANFIGYLACIGSDELSFQYSGYLTGWIYATNALEGADPQAYAKVSGMLSDRIWDDLKYNTEFWGKYEGKTAEVSNQLNDTYLKLNSQSDGVKSYGRMVDLMLAYHRWEKETQPKSIEIILRE